MAKNMKKSSPQIASLAAETLKDKNASRTAKSLAASVLAQSGTSKQTGAALETTASKVLKSGKYSDDTKSLAASALSQANKQR